ncbi:MAG: nicotinamidase [Parcubacteria group bacterium]|nr:nicotinamidase [Parcubacteria group bacterium]
MVRARTPQLPSFYDPANAVRWSYSPNLRDLFTSAQDYRRQLNIKAAAGDRFKVHLLIIDGQRDFCFPEGTLYVGGRSGTGAVDDSRRIARFIYENIHVLTHITPTLDTHFPFQIFFPSFWVDADGNPLQPHDMISADLTILRLGKPVGKAAPNPAVAGFLCNGNYTWLQKQVRFYCEKLAEGGRYQLYIWPEHCMLGSDGHTLVGVIQEARMFHSYVRQMQSEAEVKGGNPLTENYSVFSPEVTLRFDGSGVLGSKNVRFIQSLMDADALVIAGQAASHCVKSSIDHFLAEILTQDPGLAKKVYVLRDCTSAVAVPNPKGGFFVDFTDQAEEALQRYAAAGMNVVNSTEPIESWPGMNVAA